MGGVLHIDRINMLETDIVKASANICGNVSNIYCFEYKVIAKYI